jgi:hypothetical protein
MKQSFRLNWSVFIEEQGFFFFFFFFLYRFEILANFESYDEDSDCDKFYNVS